MFDCCFIVSGVFVLRDVIRSRCEDESNTEDEDQRPRRQDEYLTNFDHVKYKISEGLSLVINKQGKRSPTHNKIPCFESISFSQ